MSQENYSVKAVLSVVDKGFKSGVRGALSALGTLGNIANKSSLGISGLTGSFIGANLAATAISKGIGLVTSSAGSMISEMNSSAKAWKTFEGNEKYLGRSSAAIAKAKAEMQDYASATVFSASDMASTYSQLDAVGTKNVGNLVKGMGGLAAASDDPAQAMKTLSRQMTQMAGKPTVAWEDFRFMLEQTPAGMAAVAKEMGMSTQELVSSVKDGTVSTKDFQEAVVKAGNSASFQKMATEFKTVDQAIDGARESLANKLMPVFDKFNVFGIKAVNAVAGAFDKIDFGKVASGVGSFLGGIDIESIVGRIGQSLSNGIANIKKFYNAFKDTGALTVANNALAHLKDAFEHVQQSLGGKGLFTNLGEGLGGFVKYIGQAATGISNFISNLKPGTVKAVTTAVIGLVGSFKVMSVIASANPFTLIVAGIITLVTAFAQAYNSSAKFRDGVNKTISVIKEWGPAIAAVAGGFAIFKMLNGWNPFKKFFGGAKVGVDEAVKSTSRGKGILSQLFNGIGAVIKSTGSAVGTAAQGIGKGFATAFTALGKAIAMVPPTTFLALAVAILATGVAVWVVANGFSIMADAAIRLGQAGTGAMIMFGVMLSGLIGLVAVIGIFGAGLSAGAVGMVAFGVAALLVGAAIALVATQSAGVSQIIMAIGSAFSQVALAVGTSIAMIITAMTPLMPYIAMIVASITPVISQFIQLFRDIVAQIAPIISQISNLFMTLGQQISNILNSAGGIITSFGNSVRTVLDGIAGIFESMGNAARNAGAGVKLMAQGIAILVALPLGDLTATLASVGSGLGGIASQGPGLATTGSAMMQLGVGMMMFSASTTMAIAALTVLPGLMTAVQASATALPASVTMASTSMQTLSTIATSTVAILTSLVAGMMSFSASIIAVASGANIASSGFARLSASSQTANSSIATLASTTTSSMTSMQSTITSSMTSMQTSIQSAFNKAQNDVQNGMTRMTQAVRNGASQMASATRAGGNQLVNAVQGAMSQAVASARNGASAMQQAGYYVGRGLAVGMRQALGEVTAAANELVAQAEKAARAKAKIHSPSHLFRDEVGYFIGAGIAVGIENSTGLVQKSLGFIQDGISSFRLDTSNLVEPFDFDSVGNIQSRISSMLDTSSTVSVEHRDVTGQSQNSLIVDGLRRVNELLEEGKYIVMDTGALVGATSNQMNNSLGNTAQLGGRFSF